MGLHFLPVRELSSQNSRYVTVRALLLGDRIDTVGSERKDVLSTTPLAFRVERDGYAVLFRYGVAVLFGLSPLQEDEIIRGLDGRIIGPLARRDEESTQIEIAADKDEQITPNGINRLRPYCLSTRLSSPMQ